MRTRNAGSAQVALCRLRLRPHVNSVLCSSNQRGDFPNLRVDEENVDLAAHRQTCAPLIQIKFTDF